MTPHTMRLVSFLVFIGAILMVFLVFIAYVFSRRVRERRVIAEQDQESQYIFYTSQDDLVDAGLDEVPLWYEDEQWALLREVPDPEPGSNQIAISENAPPSFGSRPRAEDITS
ncbi:hypothetical protein P280DRAFT_480078 [Massarina eburnea CBS 473.64]|uniref:Uncharacterized protein n=1 Tax=Massarina eburnea CBS 473.64 TaxID=1395130 RepID=A0A6A6RZL5_9PLEO|nr:hypothetical protein P280DRAFT_480078 [Massarina eburnea CBS 473.64]